MSPARIYGGPCVPKEGMALMIRAVSRLVQTGECFSLRKLSNFLFRLAVYGSPLVPVVRLVRLVPLDRHVSQLLPSFVFSPQ